MHGLTRLLALDDVCSWHCGIVSNYQMCIPREVIMSVPGMYRIRRYIGTGTSVMIILPALSRKWHHESEGC